MQEFDWEEIKADLGEVVGTYAQLNRMVPLCVLRDWTNGKILETGKMKVQKI